MKGIPLTAVGGVLALLGFGAVVLLGFSASGGSRPSVPAQKPVVVAARDIPMRTALVPADLTIVQMTVDDVPPGAFQKRDDLKGSITAVDIVRGQAVTANLVVSSPDQVTTSTHDYLPIPSGFVVLTVPTSEFQGAGGYIQAGDYIAMTVIMTVKGQTLVRTVYTNLHVLKIGPAGQEQAAAPAPGTKTSRQGGSVASSMTLVLTQCQSEFINWFLVNATVKYTLESYKDYKPQDTKTDPTCPSVDAAAGVRAADINARWPGLGG